MITITWRMRWMPAGTDTGRAAALPPHPPAAPSAATVKTHRVRAAYPTTATVATPCWRIVGRPWRSFRPPGASGALADRLVQRDGGRRGSIQRLGALGLRDGRRLVAGRDHLGRQAVALGADHEYRRV